LDKEQTMPSVAPNSRIKRLLSAAHTRPSSDATNLRKKARVRFDDNVKVVWPDKYDEPDSMADVIDDDGELDFTFSVGDDGEIDYTITSKDSNKEKYNILSFDRPMSPVDGCNCFLSDGLSSHLDADFLQDSNIATDGKHFKKSIDACNHAEPDPPIAPLITPPASPKRIHTVSKYGEEEEATICEWPCNLAVDIAITAACMDEGAIPLLDYCSD
jgi:hypothetical protein